MIKISWEGLPCETRQPSPLHALKLSITLAPTDERQSFDEGCVPIESKNMRMKSKLSLLVFCWVALSDHIAGELYSVVSYCRMSRSMLSGIKVHVQEHDGDNSTRSPDRDIRVHV